MIAPTTIAKEADLVLVAAKDPEAYAGTSKAALTVYSLYWLHEWELRRTIEAISVLNWRLFPHEFSMVGFGEFPDALRTNRSLLQGQPKYRNWLTGSATTGFNLNPRGQQLAEDLVARIGPPETDSGDALGRRIPLRPSTSGAARTVEPEREVAAARQSRLFRRWKDGELGDRDLVHVHSLLGIFDHTPVKVRRQKLEALRRCADEADDAEMAGFLSDVREAFPTVFRGK